MVGRDAWRFLLLPASLARYSERTNSWPTSNVALGVYRAAKFDDIRFHAVVNGEGSYLAVLADTY